MKNIIIEDIALVDLLEKNRFLAVMLINEIYGNLIYGIVSQIIYDDDQGCEMVMKEVYAEIQILDNNQIREFKLSMILIRTARIKAMSYVKENPSRQANRKRGRLYAVLKVVQNVYCNFRHIDIECQQNLAQIVYAGYSLAEIVETEDKTPDEVKKFLRNALMTFRKKC